MFFDDLGHTFKDFIIFVLIVLSIILSINVVNIDKSLKWWYNNALEDGGLSSCKVDININEAEAEDHKTIKWVDTLAWVNIGILIAVISLIVLYFLRKRHLNKIK